MSDTPRVVATVVTFNRCDLLRRTLTALNESRPLPDLIVVVDNASSDGTVDMIKSFDSAVPLQLVELTENTGGAGGFHRGMAEAMDAGADLIWLMDDDGVPDPDCLRILLERRDEFDFYGPAVLDEADHSRLCFPIRLPGKTTVMHDLETMQSRAENDSLIGNLAPFNGVLVTRDLVQRIGLPRAEYFIWGDEIEYRMRAEENGARVATIPSARFYHPAAYTLGTPMFFGTMYYNHSESELKNYCLVRNNTANLHRYRGRVWTLSFIARAVWFNTFTRPNVANLRLTLRAIYDGWRGDFTGHTKYLR